MILEGYSIIDSIYMTVITVSTVGFGLIDNAELSDGGKIFTIILILTSIGTFAYGISAITSYFVAGEYVKNYKQIKILSKINKMNRHVIVCGFGRVGQKVCEDLKSHGKSFLVIENSEKKTEYIAEKFDYLTIVGDATNEEILNRANIESAEVLITTLPNDADNVYTVLSARELNSGLTIISRASQRTSVNKLRRAGANNVIMPDSVGGSHMASLVMNPDVMEFLDHISIQGPAEVNLEEICFVKAEKDLTLNDLKKISDNNDLNINIIGYKSISGQIVINPDEDQVVEPKTKLFVLGKKDQVDRFNHLVGADFL